MSRPGTTEHDASLGRLAAGTDREPSPGRPVEGTDREPSARRLRVRIGAAVGRWARRANAARSARLSRPGALHAAADRWARRGDRVLTDGPSIASSGRTRLVELGALALLALVGLVVYWQLIVRGYVLLGFDAFVYFYPLMTYRDLRLAAGALPLWAPGYFLGVPFLANPQTGVLYPPNWLTLPLDAARAYAWQIFGHALLLAGGSYLFARRVLGLGALGGLAAGAIAAFGGYGQSLVGHVNQLQAAAWLPVILWLGDRAWRGRSPPAVAATGLALALQLLAGHAQLSYMSVATLGAWLLGRALLCPSPAPDWLGRGPLRLSRLPWLAARRSELLVLGAVLVGAGVVAALLAAPQLLPTQEVTGQGIRAGGMSYREVVAFSLPPWLLPASLLPLYTPDGQPSSEWLGYAGVVGLIAAGLGVLVGRPRRLALLLGAIALGALLLAFGQFGPLYPVLYRVVPGLGLFRVPARWLFVHAFAVAMLAGLAVDALGRARRVARPTTLADAVTPASEARAPDRARLDSLAPARLLALVVGGLLAVIVPLAAYGTVAPAYRLHLPSVAIVAAWVALAAIATGLLGLGLHGWRPAAPLLVGALLIELIVASWPLDVNRAGPPEAYRSMRPIEAHLLAAQAALPDGPYRTLAITDSGFDPGDLALLRSQVAGLLDADRVEDWVAVVKHKDTLTPNLPLRFGIPSIDGYDGGVLPLRSYVGLKELFPLTATNLVDGRLGIQLDRLPPVELLAWLNVGWVVMDRHRDQWVDGAYYDLAVQTELLPGQAELLDGVPARARATALGVMVTPRRPLASGATALEIELVDRRGATRTIALTAPDGAPTERRLLRADLGGSTEVARLTLRAPVGGPVVTIGGVTLLDEATGVDWPIPAARGLRFSALGDVKVYQNRRALARAFLVHGIRPVADDAAARGALADGLDARSTVAIVGDAAGWAATPAGAAEPGEGVTFARDDPERVELRVTLGRPGALVLTDADYPGWRATVDGAPARIWRANGGLRAVLLEPGEHAIVFAYSSTRLAAGLALAVVGGLVAAAMAAWPWWRRNNA